jgi:hypothetical protein
MPQSETALDHEVQHQSRFKELLLEIPAHFINLTGESIDDDIEDAQRRICECLNMSYGSGRVKGKNAQLILLDRRHSLGYQCCFTNM